MLPFLGTSKIQSTDCFNGEAVRLNRRQKEAEAAVENDGEATNESKGLQETLLEDDRGPVGEMERLAQEQTIGVCDDVIINVND